jgi:hypothetical protein
MYLLNKRFGLRNLLKDTKYHNYEGGIPKEDLTIEKEPEIHKIAQQFARDLEQQPEKLLLDDYTIEERKKDWNSLVNKDVTTFDSRSRTGHKLLDYHMPHFWKVSNSKGKSVQSMMTYDNLYKAIILNTQMHSTPYKSEIRRTLVMSGGLSSVTKYRAGLSKFIVKRYNASSVLDPCIGWGGRMIGSLSANATYTGCETDFNTFKGLQNILIDIERQADIHHKPAETFLPTLRDCFVDMILTSPPYYTLELYTDGEQSVKNNISWESWVTNWLKPVIIECLRCLKHDGKSCWSVKNFKIGSRLYPLADVVQDIHKEKGYNLLEIFTIKGPGRPGNVKESEEQTYVFTK